MPNGDGAGPGELKGVAAGAFVPPNTEGEGALDPNSDGAGADGAPKGLDPLEKGVGAGAFIPNGEGAGAL